MAINLGDKPNDDKTKQAQPAGASQPAASSQQSSSDDSNDVGGSLKIEKPSYDEEYARKINNSRFNNQVNVYGEGPGEETEQDEEVRKHNESNSELLNNAAASGDADVHNLLGQRQIAELNGDVGELKRIDEEIADGQKQTSA